MHLHANRLLCSHVFAHALLTECISIVTLVVRQSVVVQAAQSAVYGCQALYAHP